jgi:site-specific DNA-methyltransferase (adenine-specific)
MINLLHGDCLELMKTIPGGSIDAIITDPPYGTTACKWDSVIPFNLMWDQLNRIIKPNGAIVLFGSEPFSSLLRCSNIKDYKYDWVWEKEQGTNQNLCKVAPLKKHENILVFKNSNFLYFSNYIKSKRILLGYSKKDIDIKMGLNTAYSWWEGRKSGIQLPSNEQYIMLKSILKLDDRFDELILKERYIPQMSKGKSYTVKRNGKTEFDPVNNTSQKKIDTINKGERYPTSILKFNRELKNRYHPTQKPVLLLEYIIKTYTNEKETVLDFTMGSGSTGVACVNTNRNFIGIEKDENYFKIATERINSKNLFNN